MTEKIFKHLYRIPVIIRYVIAGGSAGVVHLTTLYVLTDKLGLWYILSATIGFLLALSVSFTLQKFLTFENHDVVAIKKQLPLFALVGIANTLLNALGMYIFVEIIVVQYLLAQIFVAGLIAVESFFIYRFIIFPHSKDSVGVE